MNRMVEDDDSADESETISTRTLALTRYRRNHEFMNEVFMYAAFGTRIIFLSSFVHVFDRFGPGDKKAPPPPSPYSVFKLSDLDDKVVRGLSSRRVMMSQFVSP